MTDLSRRDFLKATGLGAGSFALGGCFSSSRRKPLRESPRKPNIIFILADDLGYGELGCYGQEKIKTPNIDKLASQGKRFTQHYSGSPVCAPSRCTVLTGKHTGHCFIRNNSEMGGWDRGNREGQLPLPERTETIAVLLKKAGYTTGAIGKWGLGGPGTSGEPNRQGFDHWFGYLCQRQAHNYYPEHLWRNGKKEILGNEYFPAHQRFPKDRVPSSKDSYSEFSGTQYAPDLMTEDALQFIQKNRSNPFFLYLATPVPHAAIQVPEDSLKEYEGKWPDSPYLGEKGYLPHPAPRAGYAAMVSRMDRDIGRILKLLENLGIDEETLIFFSSDNGPTFNGGTDSEFFNSTGSLRGLKGSVYEGGIRVPFVARWPGKIKPGTTTDHLSAFWDVLPTVAQVAGVHAPEGVDGISFLPTLLDRGEQEDHDYLYWEYNSSGGMQAVRMGDWKAVRLQVKKNPEAPMELYDLRTDKGEKQNLVDKYPHIVQRIEEIMAGVRTPSEDFPLFPETPPLSSLKVP